MLRNNGKIIIGRNFLFCLCVICLMFTAFGVENSFAADLNETADEMGLESNDMDKLENSHENNVLEVDSQDSQSPLAATHTPSGNTYGKIQEKVNAANAGDTILLKGTYYSTGNDRITINKKLTITSDGTATLDGKHLSTAFYVAEGGAGTVFKNLKFINGEGNVGSAIIIHSKNVHVENCIFEDNHANQGGAVNTRYDLDISSGTIVENCQFRRNACYSDDPNRESSAAALGVYGRDSEVRNCVFEDNWVRSDVSCYGGAIQVGLDEPGSNAKVTDCVFKNNHAISSISASHGGAGCVRSGTSYTNCIFIGNSADEGGALTFHSSGEIKNCTFINNTARTFGGALSTGFLYDYMMLTVSNCNFDGNSAPMGGGIQANGLNIIVDECNFKNNHVTKYGGAIYCQAEDVTVTDSVFNSNRAYIDGGAVYIKGENTHIEKSTFVSNQAIPDVSKNDDGLGGALYVNSSLTLIKDNSFKFNTARNGSAIYYDESGEKLTLENNELFQNQAWVYHLPISAEDIYGGDSQEVRVTLFGGNNIADFDNLAVSNAIFNAADNTNIVIDNEYPVSGATNSGKLYQDGREYNINVLLSIQHEDGTMVYNEMNPTSYLGEIVVDLDNLKPGKYYVTARHYEDTYYKAITNTTTFRVLPKVDNEVRKTVSKEIADFEDVVTWTLTVKNHGPNDSTDVRIVDVLPKGLIWLNDTSNGRYNHDEGILTLDKLGVNETFTFTIVTIVNATGKIVNGVNVTSNEFDSNITNNYDDESLFVNPAADIAVVKGVSDESPNYRDNIIWKIVITNNGPDIAHDVVMRDVLPEALIYVESDGDYDCDLGIWNVGTLQSGESVALDILCTVNATGFIENSVSVNASEHDYDLTNNNDSKWIYVSPSSDLAITKEVNATRANFNDLVMWTLTVSNNGPDVAANVEVADLLPDGFTYVNSTSTKGRYEDDVFRIDEMNVEETIVIEILTLAEATGNFTNFANVTSDNYDFDLTNNEDDEPIFVNPAADVSVAKSVSDSNPSFNDVITWTIEVVNNGPDAAHDVTVTDLLPSALIWMEDDSMGDYDPVSGILFIPELDVEESYTLNIDCRVNATGLIQNDVSVSASEYDYNLTNNFDNETVDVEKSADVSVIKLVNNTSPNYNDLVKWTLIITNAGPDNATNVYVEDILPEGLILVNYTASKGFYDNGMWTRCCVNVGDVQTLEMICRVNTTGRITNFASIHADEHDFNESNNEDNESIDVPPAVDLQVQIQADNKSPLFGDTVNWMISVKNNGPDNASEVLLDDILPAGLIFSGYESTRGVYANDVWTIGLLNVGDVVYLNITTVCDELGTISNDVKVTSREYDWKMSNNYAEDSIDVRPVADVSIEKLISNPVPKYGETVKWTLIASNNGPNAAHNVIVRDELPEGLTFISSNGNYHDGIWEIPILNVGETKRLEIVSKVTATGNIYNFADISSDEMDPDESNNHAEQSISVSPAADLSVTKIASRYHYRVGDVIEYVIEVVNNGPDTARNIRVTEILDDLLKLKSFKLSKGKFNRFTNVWTIESLGYGESAKLFIKVVAMGSGIIRNTVEVTSDTFDYDMSNNKDFARVKVGEKPENNPSKPSKGDSDGKMLSNLEMHPTANPFWSLMLSLMFSIIYLGNRNFKGKLF